MPKRPISQTEYNDLLGNANTVREAYHTAQENRRFEIELYWKRAAYFWTFIGATFAGYFAVQTTSASNRGDLSVVLACLGVVFSFGWFSVNRGSKKWQENWEKHVDLLEDLVTGPLYKVVLTRNDEKNLGDHVNDFFTGPASVSVSKVNQLISLFVTLIWCFLLWYALPPFRFGERLHWPYVIVVGFCVLACVSFWTIGRSFKGGFWHTGTIRTSRIPTGEERNGGTE